MAHRSLGAGAALLQREIGFRRRCLFHATGFVIAVKLHIYPYDTRHGVEMPKSARMATKQPETRKQKPAPWDKEVALSRIQESLHCEGPLLPILHALQQEFGYIDEAAEPLIAQALNITRAEVHGVVTFYHDFRREPAGRHVLKLCRAEACQAAGGDPLAARAEARLGVAMGTSAPDGSVSLEPVYCLGLCAVAPSAMLDGRLVGRLDESRLDALLAEAQQ
jgi:formate dehydrogenase subunit gamma